MLHWHKELNKQVVVKTEMTGVENTGQGIAGLPGRTSANGKEPAGGVARRFRVLLVDDEVQVRESMALILGYDGHEVDQAPSGAIALEKLASSAFDVVVTDQRMPGMNGDELARRIKAHYPGLAVLMLTGFYDQAADTDNPVLGIYRKPEDISRLRQAIAQLAAAQKPATCQLSR